MIPRNKSAVRDDVADLPVAVRRGWPCSAADPLKPWAQMLPMPRNWRRPRAVVDAAHAARDFGASTAPEDELNPQLIHEVVRAKNVTKRDGAARRLGARRQSAG
jgi:hypothetical protein